MSKDSFLIQKFVGVTPAQFAKLQAALIKEPIRIEGKWREGVGPNFRTHAEVKSVSWDSTYATLTVEVTIYDFAREYQNVLPHQPKGERHVVSEYHPTTRVVMTKILNALGRLPHKAD